MQKDIFDDISTPQASADIFDQVATKPKQPLPVQPTTIGDILSRFPGELWKDIKGFGSIALDTSNVRHPETGEVTPGPGPKPETMGYDNAATQYLLGGADPSGKTMTSLRQLPELVKASPGADLARGVKTLGRALADRAVVGSPETAIVKGLKPEARNLGFEMALDKALPEVKAAESTIGRPIQNVDDLIEATTSAKRNLWAQYKQILGPQAERGVSGAPVADAITRSVPFKTQLQNPELAGRIKQTASTYNRAFTLEELENMLHQTNAELSSYYAKYPSAQRVAGQNPDTAHLVAEADALRDTIYHALDQSGGGQAPQELKQRYGALMNLEKEAYRRRNVAARQAPMSLAEQLGNAGAVAEGLRGGVKLLSGDYSGGLDLIGALGLHGASRVLKNANKTDSLIANAMRNYTKLPEAINYTAPNIRGLLGEGPLVTPPPADTSFVRGVPGTPAINGRPKLLGPAPIPVGPAPDSSFVRGVPADPLDILVGKKKIRTIFNSTPPQ